MSRLTRLQGPGRVLQPALALAVAASGSVHATRVNGERVVGARALASGDVIAICAASLVYHASSPAVGAFTILELSAFRQRVAEEIERARAYHRPLTVVAAALGPADRPHIALTLARQLRVMTSSAGAARTSCWS